jgi:purine-cytosine permease-like protein
VDVFFVITNGFVVFRRIVSGTVFGRIVSGTVFRGVVIVVAVVFVFVFVVVGHRVMIVLYTIA